MCSRLTNEARKYGYSTKRKVHYFFCSTHLLPQTEYSAFATPNKLQHQRTVLTRARYWSGSNFLQVMEKLELENLFERRRSISESIGEEEATSKGLSCRGGCLVIGATLKTESDDVAYPEYGFPKAIKRAGQVEILDLI